MKTSRIFSWALVAAVVGAMSSCTGLSFGGDDSNDPSFRQSDLIGLWQRNETNEFVRFTDEQSDEEKYFYGREWDEGEDVHEEDLFTRYQVDTLWNIDEQTQDTLGFTLDSTLLHGLGWFKYQLEAKGDLHELHLMDNKGAEIPKEYVVAVLTDEKLEYYEAGYTNRRSYFTKVVTPKDPE